jgi:hypothetical protein
VLYYAFAVLVGLLLVSLRLEAPYRISVSIFLVSMTFGMFTTELFLLWSGADLDSTQKLALAAGKMGIKFDTRGKLAVITDLERHNLAAVPNVNPENFLTYAPDGTLRSKIAINGTETLPLAGISNKTTVYCNENENGEYVIYESDEHGFHNPKGIWNVQRIDVVAVGDSFTQGSCVPSDKNIIALIRKRYPASLNLGMVNNGPLTELATLKEYVPALKPGIVLWFYFEGNDLADLKREKQSPLLRSYVKENFSQGLLKQQGELDKAVHAYIQASRSAREQQTGHNLGGLVTTLRSIVKLERLRSRMGLAQLSPHREDPELAMNMGLFKQILLQAKALVGTWDGRLYFVYLPERQRYVYPKTASNDRDAVLTMLKSMGIPVIDMHLVFQAQSHPLDLFPFRIGFHYNDEGYRLVAEEVLHSITLDPSK